MPHDPPIFDAAFRAKLRQLLEWRRDVRRFRAQPLEPARVLRLLELAQLAPSVGLSQPWRFVTVEDPVRRQAIVADFEKCNAEALAEYKAADAGERAHIYAGLKLAGLREAPLHLAVFADRGTGQGHGLGRRTMPEMIDYSAVLAVHTLWLAARAEGIGLGWVSILDPAAVARILAVPSEWRFIAYLCLGYPETEERAPELEREGWETRAAVETFLLKR
ncbi:MAG: 5,6-dimethylbenzimidazole synthase [Alphaproteobacteria bacterium]|nr:5,6-dimethylbenzimidazole synthase [Alphaproteobacteria bacterium]